MKKTALLMVCVLAAVLPQTARTEPADMNEPVRFAPLHIYIDSGQAPLAAYQFELKTLAGQVRIVGVEGSEHAAFQHAPYYDTAALMNDRIIIAAYSTDAELPAGATRIATLHLQITGDIEPDYELILTVAADADGRRTHATITYQKGETE
ncbi:MAG: hypothetical protein ABFR90_10860 [Planctomycetota bacterium]